MDKEAPTPDERCGTYAGYKAHRFRSESLCEPCREAMNAYRREHIKRNPDFNARHKRVYQARNKDKVKTSQILGYAATRQRKAILEAYGTDCYLCGEALDLTAKGRPPHPNWRKSYWVDHVIPIHLGGTSDIANLRPSHAICNIKKGHRERKTATY